MDNARNTETVPDGHATSGGYGLLPQTVGLKSHGSDLVRRGEGDRARMRHGRAAVLSVTALWRDRRRRGGARWMPGDVSCPLHRLAAAGKDERAGAKNAWMWWRRTGAPRWRPCSGEMGERETKRISEDCVSPQGEPSGQGCEGGGDFGCAA